MAGICEQRDFQEVFTAQSKHLYHFMYYKTGNMVSAEDFVQDAFLRLWNNCAKVELGTL